MTQPIQTIGNFETGGVIFDTDPFALSNNQWSDCLNVRFDNGSVSKITGEQIMKATTNMPQELIYWRQPGSNPDRWVYIDEVGIVRRVTATAGADAPLNSTTLATGFNRDMSLFNGGATLIINDGSGAPYYLHSPDVGSPAQQELERNSTGWVRSGLTNYQAEVVRPFRNTLFAGNITQTVSAGNTVFGPSTVRVSNLAARGAVPSWNATYAGATTADEFDLATNSPIVDMVPFQDAMAIYTSDSISLVRLTGSSQLPVSVTTGSQGRGLLNKNCAVEFYGRHFVVGNEDIYTYGGGAQITSIADARVRDYFFSNLNRAAISMTIVVHNRLQSEMWIGYAKGTSALINEILIYNYDHKTWSRRTAPNARYLAAGAPIMGNAFDNSRSKIIMSHSGATNLLETDRSLSFQANPINSYVERKGLNLAPGSINVKKWNDSTYYIIRALTGHAEPTNGGKSMLVQAASTNTPGEPVDFNDTKTNPRDRNLKNRRFSLDADMGDYKVDPRSKGRYFNTRIGSNDTTSNWALISYTPAIGDDVEGR